MNETVPQHLQIKITEKQNLFLVFLCPYVTNKCLAWWVDQK